MNAGWPGKTLRLNVLWVLGVCILLQFHAMLPKSMTVSILLLPISIFASMVCDFRFLRPASLLANVGDCRASKTVQCCWNYKPQIVVQCYEVAKPRPVYQERSIDAPQPLAVPEPVITAPEAVSEPIIAIPEPPSAPSQAPSTECTDICSLDYNFNGESQLDLDIVSSGEDKKTTYNRLKNDLKVVSSELDNISKDMVVYEETMKISGETPDQNRFVSKLAKVPKRRLKGQKLRRDVSRFLQKLEPDLNRRFFPRTTSESSEPYVIGKSDNVLKRISFTHDLVRYPQKPTKTFTTHQIIK